MSDTSAKFFLSTQSVILPAMSGVAGALAALVKACLVSGVGAANVQSLVVAGGVATATYADPHYRLPGQVELFAGATPSQLNGEARILSVPTANSLTFATTAADGAATGSITSKLAPAGWEEAFSGTNKTALRSLHEDASGMLLRIDDTGTTSARVVGYKTMADVDTGTGPFPAADQQAGGLYWPKAHNTTGNRAWALVADERAFYLYVQPTTGNSAGSVLGFGDFITDHADLAPCFIAGHAAALFTGGAGCLSVVGTAAAATLATPNSASVADGAQLGYLASALRSSGVSGNAAGSLSSAFPDPAHGSLLLTHPMVVSSGMRGTLPGLRHTPQSVLGRLVYPDRAVAPGYLPLTTLLSASAGVALVQITGDWRA
jgi:hypothetical protein